MTIESLLVWIVVGLIAGWLASAVVGGGYGVVGDIVIGVVGSFLGAYIFGALGWHSPFPGLAGVILVAFVGAIALLLILRAVRMLTRRTREA